MNSIIINKRVTTVFLSSLPIQLTHFDGSLYVVVKRRKGKDIQNEKWGKDVRLDPCTFNWERKEITINIPLNINYGINDINDLEPHFFESIEAAFLTLIFGCVPS